MNEVCKWQGEELKEQPVPVIKDLGRAANDLCEKALSDAKGELHPLLRSIEPFQLERRAEFVQAFKLALENRIAQKIAALQPMVQAVYKFDESWMESRSTWDGSIHLLVKVPRLTNAVKMLSKHLDRSLVRTLQQLGWSRFREQRSILEVQQVTPSELRHGIGYGAMFLALYSAPVKVWSPKTR